MIRKSLTFFKVREDLLIMKSIYTSKLYRASSRKDKIDAALAAPSNLSLVQQLSESLDEEYRTPENLGLESPKAEESKKEYDDLIVDDEIDPENDLVKLDDFKKDAQGSEGSKSSHSTPSPKGHRKVTGLEPNDVDGPEESGDSKESKKPDANPASDSKDNPPKETEASTKVMSSTQINISAIKDSLNSRDDTSGVSRVAQKENEIWIYYKDEVNLNNIMTDVIEYMNDSINTSLEFNRLARSDNAIVFQYTKQTDPEFKSIDPPDKDQVIEDNNLETATD